jgi:hypothetical protein
MEEEFYATIKLSSGEEIVAKVSYDNEDDVVIVLQPRLVTKTQIKKRGIRVEGFEFSCWINATHDDMFIIPRSQIITMIETDIPIVEFYEAYLKRKTTEDHEIHNGGIPGNRRDLKFMDGYITSTKEARSILEEIYNKS